MQQPAPTVSKLDPRVCILPFKIKNASDYIGYVDLFDIAAFNTNDHAFTSPNVSCNLVTSAYSNIIQRLLTGNKIKIAGLKILGTHSDDIKNIMFINNKKDVYTPNKRIVDIMAKNNGIDPRNQYHMYEDMYFEFIANKKSSIKIIVSPMTSIEVIFYVTTYADKYNFWQSIRNFFSLNKAIKISGSAQGFGKSVYNSITANKYKSAGIPVLIYNPK